MAWPNMLCCCCCCCCWPQDDEEALTRPATKVQVELGMSAYSNAAQHHAGEHCAPWAVAGDGLCRSVSPWILTEPAWSRPHAICSQIRLSQPSVSQLDHKPSSIWRCVVTHMPCSTVALAFDLLTTLSPSASTLQCTLSRLILIVVAAPAVRPLFHVPPPLHPVPPPPSAQEAAGEAGEDAGSTRRGSQGS